ncbi:MAG TPA: hypothetical protein VLH15_11575, partial [Dehalococcoidales bacterium]|nr:hypothetical protein [Dehalococcoidales bacterium]
PAGRAAGLWGKGAYEGGKYYEIVKAFFDVSDAVIDYRQPYRDSGWDLTVSIITTGGGFSPWWWIAGLFQSGWDTNKAGTQFFDEVEERGRVNRFKP